MTPGPWAVSRLATPEHSPEFAIYSELESPGRDLARVVGNNAEANAHLIAAAPKVLKELRAGIEAAQAVIDCWSRGDLAGAVNCLDGWIDDARELAGKFSGVQS